MREYIRQQLAKEMTRGQFLQVLGGILLAVFGFHNLAQLLVHGPPKANSGANLIDNGQHGFGSRSFGQ